MENQDTHSKANRNHLKYRIWDNEAHRYWQVNECALYLDGEGRLIEYGMYVEEDYPGRYVIERCTGVEDKNGTLIYEGDVLKSYYDFFIFFDGERMRIKRMCDKYLFECSVGAFLTANLGTYIVGNIHEREVS